MSVDVDLSVSNNNEDWTEFNRNVDEQLTPKMPETCGRAVSIYLFIDTKHAENFLTKRSQTGIIMFIQNVPTTICRRDRKSVV